MRDIDDIHFDISREAGALRLSALRRRQGRATAADLADLSRFCDQLDELLARRMPGGDMWSLYGLAILRKVGHLKDIRSRLCGDEAEAVFEEIAQVAAEGESSTTIGEICDWLVAETGGE